MRLLIFAFNPYFIDANHIETLRKWLENNFDCNSYFIPHSDEKESPLFLVEALDVMKSSGEKINARDLFEGRIGTSKDQVQQRNKEGISERASRFPDTNELSDIKDYPGRSPSKRGDSRD